MPLQEVNRLSVSGEIQLNRIVFSGVSLTNIIIERKIRINKHI